MLAAKKKNNNKQLILFNVKYDLQKVYKYKNEWKEKTYLKVDLHLLAGQIKLGETLVTLGNKNF